MPSPTLQPTPGAARGRFIARILANQPICWEHYRLSLAVDGFPPTRPGQFLQLQAGPEADPLAADADAATTIQDHLIEWQPGQQPVFQQPELIQPQALLRRPYSIAARRDTPEGCEIDVIYRTVGIGTGWLAQRKPGESIDLIGPLGNGFDLTNAPRRLLLVGGGVGLPPMIYLAEHLTRTSRQQAHEAIAFLGATTSDLLAVERTEQPPDPDGVPSRCVEPFTSYDVATVITTDDGSLGMKGLITEALQQYIDGLDESDRADCLIMVCGPDAMMRATAQVASRYHVACQVSVENAMACGMGTCQSCVVKIREDELPPHGVAGGVSWRYRLACKDGPVFAADRILWE